MSVLQDETLSLGVEQFITLMVHLAFGRDNPRYVAAKESKKEETVPVLQCVQNLMNEFLPRMHQGNAAELRVALKVRLCARSVGPGFDSCRMRPPYLNGIEHVFFGVEIL